MRRSFALASAAVSVLVAACVAGGSPTPTGTPGASGSPSPSGSPAGTVPPGGIAHPTGATDLVLRIDVGGGFVAPQAQVGRIPQLSIFGDGRVIVPGPQIEIYPGPALPSLVTLRVSEDGLQKALGDARTAGLLGPDAQYPGGPIMDAPTTTFTVAADGRTHVITAYALQEGGAGDQTLDPAVRAARAALLAFEQRASDARSWLGTTVVETEHQFEPTAIRIFSIAAQPAGQGGITPSVVDWPLSAQLASFGAPFGSSDMRCGVVSGSDLARLLPLLRTSNQLTYWRSGGSTYQLTLRPLLPDESGCPTGT